MQGGDFLVVFAGSSGEDAIFLDVEGHEGGWLLTGLKDEVVPIFGVTNVLEALIEVPGPEVGTPSNGCAVPSILAAAARPCCWATRQCSMRVGLPP